MTIDMKAIPSLYDITGDIKDINTMLVPKQLLEAAEKALGESAVEPPSPSPTAGMNIAQRILHVGGRNNAAGYVEFGSIQAVEALVRQVLRDLPPAEPAVEPVAVRYDFDGYGWRYVDNGSGSDWLERGMKLKDAELVYTVPPPPAEVLPPAKRSGVFGYLDGEVRKEMAGFYDAFGMQQPSPPAEVAAEKARRDAEGGAQ